MHHIQRYQSDISSSKLWFLSSSLVPSGLAATVPRVSSLSAQKKVDNISRKRSSPRSKHPLGVVLVATGARRIQVTNVFVFFLSKSHPPPKLLPSSRGLKRRGQGVVEIAINLLVVPLPNAARAEQHKTVFPNCAASWGQTLGPRELVLLLFLGNLITGRYSQANQDTTLHPSFTFQAAQICILLANQYAESRRESTATPDILCQTSIPRARLELAQCSLGCCSLVCSCVLKPRCEYNQKYG